MNKAATNYKYTSNKNYPLDNTKAPNINCF